MSLPELALVNRRIAALEQFNRDTRLLSPTKRGGAPNPLGMLWPEIDAAFVS